jgi:hypothetical protein
VAGYEVWRCGGLMSTQFIELFDTDLVSGTAQPAPA